MSLTLFEQLPKEKTSVLGTAEVSLADLVYKSIEYKNNSFNECDADEKLIIVGCPENNTTTEGQGNTDNNNNNSNQNANNAVKKPIDGNEKLNNADEVDPLNNDSTVTTNPNDMTSYLTITKTAPINYLNPRLLPTTNNNNKGDDDSMKGPEFTIEVTISNFLIDPEIIEHGNFINLQINELYPVPDEWSLKEGTEKDLNSSK